MDFTKWPIVNAVAFLGTVAVNYFASAENTAVSDSIDIYFKPIGLTFSIWALIYGLLLYWIIMQFKKGSVANEQANRIGPFFAVSSVLNGFWLLAFSNRWFWVSLVVMVLLLLVVITMYTLANKPAKNMFDLSMFSLYVAWISVATIVNTFAVMKAENITSLLGMNEAEWTSIMLLVGVALSLLFMFINRDALYPLVFIWAYVGILLRTDDATISIVLIGALLFIVLGVGGLFLWKRFEYFWNRST